MSETSYQGNVAVWFEIPAGNFERTAGFYETIFATGLKRNDYDGRSMGVFPYEMSKVGGCVLEQPGHKGKGDGTVVYLNCEGRLDEVAGRVEEAGGKLLTPRIDLPEGMGSFYQISDCEGNRVGLYAIA